MNKSTAFDAGKVLEAVRREGICVLPEFLPSGEIEAIAAEGRSLLADMPPFVRRHEDPGADGSFLLNLIPVRLTRNAGWDRVPSVERIKSLPVVRETADGYLGRGWGMSSFIYNYSKAPSADELFKLHFDVFQGNLCMKVYVYLNAGSRENGAFRYVPRTHLLARAALPKMYKPGTKMVEENHLGDLLKTIEENPDLIADPQAHETFQLLQGLERNPEKSYEYVVAGGPGTVVIFDTAGIHGGGKIASGERYIARYHFVDAGFVFKNLPDQLPPVKRMLSHARRISRKLLRLQMA